MPRIRNIKPQFWIDENLGKISREARLLYIGLWNLSDDTGVFEWRPDRIRVQLFPYDTDINSSTIEQWLNSLQDTGDIIAFTYNNNQYGYIKSFKEHQVINKPSKYTFAPIPEHIIQEDYSSSVVVVDEDYSSTTTPVTVGNRGEGNRLKGLGIRDIRNIYSLWNEQKIIEHKELTPAIKASIEKILKDYSVEDVEQSIKNYATILKSPDYYFKYKWTLQEFLTRNKGNNIERFLDIETAKANFKRDANNGNGKDKWTGLPGNKPTGAFDFIDQQ